MDLEAAVFFVAFLVFGTRLPAIARSVENNMMSFRQGLREVDVRKDIEESVK